MEGLGFKERGKPRSSAFKPLKLKTLDSGFRPLLSGINHQSPFALRYRRAAPSFPRRSWFDTSPRTGKVYGTVLSLPFRIS